MSYKYESNLSSSIGETENQVCKRHYVLGSFGAILFTLSFFLNFSLQILILRSKELRTTKNLLLIAMLIMNLLNGIIDIPMLVIKIFSCR